MNKRALCMLLAIAVLLSVGTVSACAVENPSMPSTEDEVVSWPTVSLLADLIPGQNISVQNSSFTTTFSAASGEGNIIRVWYKNQTTRPVTVIVKQIHWYGSLEVLRFTIPAGQGAWREYSGHSGNQKYSVRLESNGGGNLIGYLRAVQTFTHYTD